MSGNGGTLGDGGTGSYRLCNGGTGSYRLCDGGTARLGDRGTGTLRSVILGKLPRYIRRDVIEEFYKRPSEEGHERLETGHEWLEAGETWLETGHERFEDEFEWLDEAYNEELQGPNQHDIDERQQADNIDGDRGNAES